MSIRSLLRLRSQSTRITIRPRRLRWHGPLEDRLAPAAFAPGNLVIYRVGTGSGSLGSGATAVFLDEYTTSGTLVQSIAMPTADSGSQKALTASGTATSEGLLTRSVDGRYLLVPGYDAIPGTTGVATSSSSTVPRVAGRVDASVTIDTTTALTNFANASNIRGVASTDGSQIWVSGPTGIAATTFGSTTATALNTSTNARALAVASGQLYVTSGSSGAKGVNTVGTGLPTSGTQTITRLPGLTDSGNNSSYQFYFADLSPSVPGYDTLYIADDTAGNGLQKFSLVSGVWTLNGAISITGNNVRGLTGVVNGSTVNLYVTGGTNALQLLSYVDSTGYNQSITGSFTTVATAATNTAFRGIAFVPSAVPTVSSMTRASYATTNASSVNYSVTFSRSVTGVDATDFKLTSSGVTGASVTSVSGSGTTYTVTVNTGSGDGTLRLDLTDDDSIQDQSGLPLGGPGAGNANFTSGESYTLVRNLVADDSFYTSASASQARGEYSVTFLGGQNPSSFGWNGIWTTATGNENVTASGLSASGITSAGGGVDVSDNSRVSRTLSTTYSNASATTVYMRVLLKLPTDSPGAYRAFELHNGGQADSQRVLQLGQNTTDFGNNNWGLRLFHGNDNSNNFKLDLGSVSAGSTEVFVLKFVFGTNSNADSVTVWRNPAGSPTELTGGQTLSNFDLSFDRVSLANFNTGASWFADEIRLGNSWSSVAPADVTPPTVSSITRVGSATTNASSVQYTVTFSEAVTGVDATDFALTTSGLSGTSISNVSGSGTTYTVTVNTGSGDGTLRLDVQDDDSILDLSGNKLGGTGTGNGNFTAGEVYTLDRTAPTITISAPSVSLTRGGPVTFTVTYADANFNSSTLATGNVTLNTTGTATGTVGVTGSGTTYTVTVSSIIGDGTLGISIAAGTATDTAGNSAGAAGPSGTFNVDNTAPTVSLSSTAPDPTNAAIPVTVLFSDPVTGFTAAGLVLGNATVSGFTGSGAAYSFTLNPTGQGAVSVSVAAGAASDAAGNGNTVSNTISRTYDSVAPAGVSIAVIGANPSNASSVQFAVTFSEPVTGFGVSDILINVVGPSGCSVTGFTGAGAAYTVTVSTGTGDGQIIPEVVDHDTIVDAAGNPLGGPGTGNGTFYGPVLLMDHTPPDVTLSSTDPDPTNAPVSVTMTFSENVTGFTPSDLVVMNAAVGNFQGLGGPNYSFTLTPTAQGAFSVSLPAGVAVDQASNPNTASNTLTRTFDSVPPAVSSVVRADANPTGAATVHFTVTFSELVSGVDAGDFLVNATGVTGASVTGVSGSGAVYTVTVDTGTGSGTLGIDFSASASGGVADAAANVSSADFTGGEVYSVSIGSTFPSVVSVTRDDADPTNAAVVHFHVTFDSAVTGVDSTDFALTTTGTLAGMSVTGVSGSGAVYTVTVGTGGGSGTLRLDVTDDDSITDGGGNALGGPGNGNGDFTSGEFYTLDRTAPVLVSVTPNAATVADANTGIDGFWLDLTFSEPMDPASTPAVSFPVENPGPTLVFDGGAWQSATVFRALYNVTDYNVSLANIDVQITGGADVVGNAGGASTVADVFAIDMQNPVVIAIYRVGASPTNAATAAWTVTFSEPVSGVAAGNFTLASVNLGGTPAITSVTGLGTTWTITASAGTGDGTLGVNFTSGVSITDAVGNTAVPPVTGPLFKFDRTAPTVVSVTPNVNPVNDAAVGNPFTLTVAFSEPMDTAVNPSVSFPAEDPSATLTPAGGSWTNSTTFVVSYSVFDANVELANVDVKVTGGADLVGNVHTQMTALDLFNIDTLNPALVSINRDFATYTNAGTVTWTVIFSEPVTGVGAGNFSLVSSNLSGLPAIISVTGTGATRTVTASTGTGDGTLRLDLTANAAVFDTAGNLLSTATFTGQSYTIDRTAPLVLNVDPNEPIINVVNSGGVFALAVTFSEPMDQTLDPAISFPGLNPGGVLTYTGGSWSNLVTFVATYGVGNVAAEIPNIDVRVDGARDRAGNAQVASTRFTLFSIDTLAPQVTAITRAAASPTNAGVVAWNVTFSEPVAVVASAFTLVSGAGLGGTPQIISVTGAGANWQVTATTGSGDGTLRLDLTDATGVSDLAANLLSNAPFPGPAYVIDITAPTVTSIVPSPVVVARSSINGFFHLTVTFSEPMDQTVDPTVTFPGNNLAGVLSYSGGSWVNGSTFDASYGVLNSAVEIPFVAVRVVGARDLAGNTQVTSDTPNVLSIDTFSPLVTFISRADANPSNAGQVTWNVLFSEPVAGVAAGNFTLVSTGIGGVPQILSVTGSAFQWQVTATTGTGTGTLRLDLTDGTGITDGAGNPLSNAPLTGQEYTFDRAAPTVTSITPSRAVVSDAIAGGIFSLTVAFSEPMDTGTNPVISFPNQDPSGTLSYSSSTWIDAQTYKVSYFVTDANSDVPGVDVRVSGGQDATGNTQLVSDTPNVFAIDTKNPLVTGITRTGGNPTNGLILGWDVTFSEPVSNITAANFNLVFAGAGGTPGISSVTGGGALWHVAAFTGISDGTVRLDMTDSFGGVADAAGNAVSNVPFQGQTYTVDTTHPTVASVTTAPAQVTDAVVGPGLFSITVTFSEAMDTSGGYNPVVLVPNSAADSTLTYNSAYWANATAFVTVFDVADANVEVSDLDVLVSGGRDLAGNGLGSYTANKVFSIDTKNPSLTAISRANASPTNAAAVSWTVTFDQAVTGLTAANFALVNNGLSGAPAITNVTGSGTVWTVTASTGTGDGTLRLDLTDNTTITDPAGNVLSNTTFAGDTYTLDRTAPTALSVTPSVSVIADALIGGLFHIRVQFSETMDTSATPAVSFPAEDPSAAITPAGGAWSSTVYTNDTFTLDYFVSPSDIGLPDVDVQVSGGQDVAGNAGVSATFTDVFSIDTHNPIISSITPNGANPTNAAAVSWTVTFSEPVTGLTAANFSLTVNGLAGTPAVTAVTGSGATWTVMASTGSGDGTIELDLVNSSGAGDLAGNAIVTPALGQSITIDRTPPTVLSVSPTTTLINDDLKGKSFGLVITFSEPMDQSTTPTITFPVESPGGTLAPNGGQWLNPTTYAATYGVFDANIDVRDIDVRVTGAQDLAGNTQTPSTTPDVFSIDTLNPLVNSITRIGNSPTNAGLVAWTVTFSEPVVDVPASAFTLVSNGLGGNPQIMSIVGAGTTWVVIGSTGTGDGTLQLNLTNRFAVTDLAGNVLGNITNGDTYTIDRTAPAATGVTPPYATITDALVGGVLHLIVHFSEPMDTTVAPAVDFGVPDLTEPSSGNWIDPSTFDQPFTAIDNNDEVPAVDVKVSGAQDLAGNAAPAASFSGVFSIDTRNPPVLAIDRAGANPSNAAAVSWTVTFDEAVSGLGAGNFTLVSSGLGGTPAITTVTGSGTTWTVTASTGTGDGTLRLDFTDRTGVTDAAGNAAATIYFMGADYTLDRTAPTALAVSAAPTLISDTTVGAGTFALSVVFSEPMDHAFAPSFSFPVEDPTGTISFASGSWTGPATYTAVFNVIDANVDIRDVDVQVSGGQDAAGNAAAAATFADRFSIDTRNPIPTIVTRLDPNPTKAGTLHWHVNFSEPVFNLSLTDFSLADTTGGAMLTNLTGGGKSWTITANVPSMTGSVRLDVTGAGGAADAAGNHLVNVPFTGATYTLDWTPPSVTTIVPSVGLISYQNLGPQMFWLDITFSEPLDQISTPTVAFPVEDPSATLTAAGGSWLSPITYRARFNVADADADLRNIDVRVTGGADLLGNVNAGTTIADVFSIDTHNPRVFSIDANDPTFTNAQSVSWTVTFTEPVTGLTAANFILFDGSLGGPSITSVVGSGTTWVVTADTATGEGTLSLYVFFPDNVYDAAGNLLYGLPVPGPAYYIDHVPPTVPMMHPSVSVINGGNAGPGGFTVTVSFSEPMNTTLAPSITFPGNDPDGSLTATGGSWLNASTYRAVYTVANLNVQVPSIDVRVAGGQDLVGNPMAPQTLSNVFAIDTHPPVVLAITRLSADPTGSASVAWQITFDEPVTGLSATNFALANSGLGGTPAITSLAGSGTTWTVTASTGTGNGTLRLDLVNNANITDLAANPLAGTPYAGPAYQIAHVPPPTVTGVQVNDGSAQRSMVTSLIVTFSEAVSFPNGINNAFQLVRSGPGGPTGTVNLSAVQTGNTVTITFAAGGAVPIDPAGSLADGAYVLTVLANQVTGAGGALDGNADLLAGDDYSTPATGTGRIFRLFGDADGSGSVDVLDFGAFRQVFGTANSIFDYDGGGSVDVLDFGQFRQRFGTQV